MAKTKSKAQSKLPVVLSFAMLNDTPGATRFQEQDAKGTPLTGDADGANVGGLYLRKAALGTFPKGTKLVVTIDIAK